MKDSTKETDARIIIDDLLKKVGWDPSDKSQVRTEVTIRGSSFEMADESATYSAKDGDVIPTGRADYILQSTNGRPLALIEAKRSAIHPYTAKQQALPLAKRIGAPFIFLTNGELIYFWDYTNDDARVIN